MFRSRPHQPERVRSYLHVGHHTSLAINNSSFSATGCNSPFSDHNSTRGCIMYSAGSILVLYDRSKIVQGVPDQEDYGTCRRQ